MKKFDISKVNVDYLLLFIIVLLGCILRFYNLFEIPYTHDELSALIRLNFSSFRELIENGVKEDGHPAGMQVFLFYWTKLFGFKEYIVKLPFILFGIGSILLAFSIAKKWFNSTTALLVSAFIATLQFPILFSQLARPYSSGLFFALLSVLFWSKFLFETPRNLKYLIGYILTSAACCYNHYFSLLFSAIIAFSGLFFIKKDNYKQYLLAQIAVAILFVPHLKIFFYQLSNGGLEWLGKPHLSFIADHFKFIFHFSPLVYLTTLSIAIYPIIKSKKITITKFQVISAIWFLLPLTIGFLYSVLAKPVLQHSVLIFSFPFIIILLFSFYSNEKAWFKICSVIAILIINTFTLISTRKHYEVLYKQPFKEFSIQSHNFLEQHKDSAIIMFAGNPNYINFYFKQYNPSVNYIVFQDNFNNVLSLRDFLSKDSMQYLICGNIPLKYWPIINEYYPLTYSSNHGFTFDYFIFKKSGTIPQKDENQEYYSSSLTKDSVNQEWRNHEKCWVKDSFSRCICRVDSTMEWGPSFTTSLQNIVPNRHAIIYVKATVKANKQSGLIVFDISKNGKNISWQGSPIKDFCNTTDNWQNVYLTVRLTDVIRSSREMKGYKLSIFLWNNNQDNILIKDFSVTTRKGNNRIYGLYEDLD
ncbi:MAG: glycosyltransferase family 39 protein [Bacteroidales bacterium]